MPQYNPARKNVLFVCGSLNQTTQMHQIAQELPDYNHFYTPFFAEGAIEILRKIGIMEYTILGGEQLKRTLNYAEKNDLAIDYGASAHQYDLVVRCTDLMVPRSIRGHKSVLVQEGMTDPQNIRFQLIKYFGALPRWAAGTAALGLSDEYDKFCVASPGYFDLFVENGVRPDKILITGIPNFDNCKRYYQNEFPHKNYVLVCTSDLRETMKFENRPKFIKKCLEIAAGRQLIFKLHPNEMHERATREINEIAPEALVYAKGSAEEMVANCDVLITRYSTVVFVASALGKEIYSDLEPGVLRKLTPIQNASAAKNIASVCQELIEEPSLSHETAQPWLLKKNVLKHDIKAAFTPASRKKQMRYGV